MLDRCNSGRFCEQRVDEAEAAGCETRTDLPQRDEQEMIAKDEKEWVLVLESALFWSCLEGVGFDFVSTVVTWWSVDLRDDSGHFS